MDVVRTDDAAGGLSRRQMLKRGALVAGAAAWTIPLVQAVSMTPAHADTTSGVPGNPGQPGTPTTPPGKTTTPPGKTTTPSGGSSGSTAGSTTSVSGSQPTGSSGSHDIDAITATGPTDPKSPTKPLAGSTRPLASTGVDYPIVPTVAAGLAAVAVGAGALALGRSRDDGSEDAKPTA